MFIPTRWNTLQPIDLGTLFDVAKDLLGNILVSVDLQCHLR